MTLADLTQQHMVWILTHLAIIYSAMAGALARLLLVRHEPFWVRSQNAIAGIILALVLAPVSAGYFNDGGYVEGYAFAYGIIARELVVSFVEAVNHKAIPLFYKVLDAIPFIETPAKPHYLEKDDPHATDRD